MINAIRKSFFLVDGGEVSPAHQDTEFDGINNILVFARSAIEAFVIAEAYANEAIGVDNVVADDGEVVAAVSAPSDDALNEWIEIHGKKLITGALLELVMEKGCVQVTAGVYVQTAKNLVAEQVTWGPEDLSAEADFSVAPFWITTDSGDDPVPVVDEEDSELAALVTENMKEIIKIIESHSTDVIVLCEVDPDTMTFTVVEEAQPQPKKIEPTIKYYHECPWAVVKTRDGEHSLEVSLTNLHYSEDGKPYLLAYQNTDESGPQELHLYLI